MRLVTNDSLVKRNATIGKYATIGGLGVLVLGLVINLAGRDNPALVLVPYVTLLLGFVLSNAGMYFSNRYGREPRADKAIAAALKGLDDKYQLYSFYLPGAHFLIAPTGIYSFTPKFQSGVVQWDGKRWKHKNANFLLTFFGQEGLSNPNSEAASDANGIAKFLARNLEGSVPPVQPVIIFYNDNVKIDADMPPIPAMHVKQLKEYLRKLPKSPSSSLSLEQVAQLDKVLKLE
jgi:hypothetical protein